MKKSAVILCLALLVAIVMLSGCTGFGSTANAPTPTPQIIIVTVMVTPTETTPPPVQAVTTAAADPAVGRKWMYHYEFGDPNNRYTFYRNMSMIFIMDDDGTTNGTITSDSGASATITGIWYKDPETQIYYITPITCIALDTNWGEVLTPSGQSVKWDMNAPDIPGKDNPYHWCEENGEEVYMMKYMAPRTLAEMDYSNTRIAIGGITFTAVK